MIVEEYLDYDAIMRRRAEIEEELRAELKSAQAQFHEVKERYRKAADLVVDIGANSPDGHQALRALVLEQRRAISRYTAALKEFEALVLGGVVPARFHDS